MLVPELLPLQVGKDLGAMVHTGVAGTGASDCVGDGVEEEDDNEEGDDSEDGDEGGDVGNFSVNRGGHRPLMPVEWLMLLRLELVLLLLAVLQPLSRLLLLLLFLLSSSSSISSSSCWLNCLQLLIRKNGG